MTELDNVWYSYKTPEGVIPAVNGISARLSAPVTAIVGKTGSGKSTLSELICGLKEPDTGSICINGKAPVPAGQDIGFVFQYPEHQLFAETVFDDIAYAPSLSGVRGAELDRIVREASALAGLGPELLSLSPFELSGGQKRLAALAGILAQRPSLLLLDEPASGLDPRGKRLVFSVIKELAEKKGVSVIFVTHSMDDAAEYADEMLVLENGRTAAQGAPEEIFKDVTLPERCGLMMPETMRLGEELRRLGIELPDMLTPDRAFGSVTEFFHSRGIFPRKGV